MKTILALVLILASMTGLEAQLPSPVGSAIVLKTGQTIPVTDFQRKDTLLMVAVTTSSGGKGQVGYNVADVAELKLLAPPELSTASALIAKGQPDSALTLIDPVVAFQQTLRDIPGNWWARASLVKCSALFALNRGTEAQPILEEIVSTSKDPETQVAAKLQLAILSPPKDPTEALSAYDTIISQSKDAKTLTRAWIAEGDIHFSQHAFDDALLAYLTVIVFYPNHNPLMPKALWCAAQSYGKLKDKANEEKTLQTLMTNYPDTPEAFLAKAEYQKETTNP